MNFFKKSLIVLGALILLGGATYLYASSGIKSKEGYVDMKALTSEMGTPLLSLKLGRSGSKPAQWLLEHMDDDLGFDSNKPRRALKSALKDLQATQLKVFNIDGNRAVYDDAISEAVASLKAKQWQTMAAVRDGKVKIVVLQYLNDTQLTGLSFIVSTDDKAVFLNLIGPFNFTT